MSKNQYILVVVDKAELSSSAIALRLDACPRSCLPASCLAVITTSTYLVLPDAALAVAFPQVSSNRRQQNQPILNPHRIFCFRNNYRLASASPCSPLPLPLNQAFSHLICPTRCRLQSLPLFVFFSCALPLQSPLRSSAPVCLVWCSVCRSKPLSM
jgi:hypothetical protein